MCDHGEPKVEIVQYIENWDLASYPLPVGTPLAPFHSACRHDHAPKAQHSYLLPNHFGRVSMLDKTYQTDGLKQEASP
jgi:hypothetical protein